MSDLAKAREACKLTLAQAAAKLGWTAATLRCLEEGAFDPRPEEAQALRNLYGAALTQPVQGGLFD